MLARVRKQSYRSFGVSESAAASSAASKPFRVGFIGAGGIAGTHMKYLKAMSGVEITAAADIFQKNLDKARTEYGVQRTYEDYKDMLKKETEIEAISVCTPNGLHAANTIAALEAGKHVMVEKPMGMNS